MNAEVVRMSNGQVTVPVNICRKLGLRDGDKVAFFEDAEKIVFANAAKLAFANIRQAFAGEAERRGLKTEEDVAALVNEARGELRETDYARST
jgi:bifunctional DNA-binding transcriptional regulator/antitoxin component of YhaV-PrlF toxin-antitoxin module